MDSDHELSDNSFSYNSQDEADLKSLKTKIFYQGPPTFYSTIQKFHAIISDDLYPIENIEKTQQFQLQTQIIVGILNKCMDKIAKIRHMSVLLEPIKALSEIFVQNMGKPNKYVYEDKLTSFYQSQINDATEELDARRQDHYLFKKERNDHIKCTEDKIQLASEQLRQDIFRLVCFYNKQQLERRISSDLCMDNVQQLHRELSKKLATTVKAHKSDENILKCRKQKLDVQLAQWIGKYDKDIGEREEELQQLTEIYETSSIEYAELSKVMNAHEIVYNQTILEKTTEERRVFEMKLRTLMCARAARVLQRAWRAHRAQQKRKKRKGGKRKQK